MRGRISKHPVDLCTGCRKRLEDSEVLHADYLSNNETVPDTRLTKYIFIHQDMPETCTFMDNKKAHA